MVPTKFQQYSMARVRPNRGGCHKAALYLACKHGRHLPQVLGLGFGKGEGTLTDTLKYKLSTGDRSQTCDGCYCPVLVLGRFPSPEGDTVVVTFLPKSTGFGAFINCQGAALAPFHRCVGRGRSGPRHSWGFPHIHWGFQPSSAFPNPTEGCAVMNNICIAWMGM